DGGGGAEDHHRRREAEGGELDRGRKGHRHTPASMAERTSASVESALSLSIWHVPAASCPPPPCASISAPMSTLELLSRIDLPTARTVFCFLRPHITWIDTLHWGKRAYTMNRLPAQIVSSPRRSRTTVLPCTRPARRICSLKRGSCSK